MERRFRVDDDFTYSSKLRVTNSIILWKACALRVDIVDWCRDSISLWESPRRSEEEGDEEEGGGGRRGEGWCNCNCWFWVLSNSLVMD